MTAAAENLAAKTTAQIRQLVREYGMKAVGSKQTLIDQIIESDEAIAKATGEAAPTHGRLSHRGCF